MKKKDLRELTNRQLLVAMENACFIYQNEPTKGNTIYIDAVEAIILERMGGNNNG